MKKVLLILLVLILVATLCITAVACKKSSGTDIKGTYYLYKNGTYDKTDYIVIEKSTWKDSDDVGGTYKRNGNALEFYIDLAGESELLYEGTIENGVIALDDSFEISYYCKEGSKPKNQTDTNVDTDKDKPNGGNTPGGNDTPAPITQYTVTYDADGGTFADERATLSVKVDKDGKLTAPTSPTRIGYTFAGWATTKGGGDMWRFADDAVTQDITLYATWTAQSAVILSVDGATIQADGGDMSVLMIVDRDVESVSLANKVVTSSDSTWRLYYDKLGQTEIPTKIAASTSGELNGGDNIFYMLVTSQNGTQVNLYTLNVHRSHPVTVYYYDEEFVIEDDVVYSGDIYNAAYTPDIEGYRFNGWQTSTGTAYTPALLLYNLSLYADKTALRYPAALDVKGGDALTTVDYTFTYDADYRLPVPTLTGYSFCGWYADIPYKTQLTDGAGASLREWRYTATSTVAVYAEWEANIYHIYANATPAAAGTVSGAGDYACDRTFTLTADTNEGYTFVGWFEEQEKLAEGSLTYSAVTPAKNRTITAKWIECPITVESEDEARGTVARESRTVLGRDTTITATPAKGFSFDGWFVGDNKVSNDIAYTFELTEDAVTYTAHWSVFTLTVRAEDGDFYCDYKYHTVNFNTMGGTSIPSQTVATDASLTYPDYPYRANYVFRGWYTDTTCTVWFDFDSPITHDMTLFAGWEYVGRTFDSFKVYEPHSQFSELKVYADSTASKYYYTYATNNGEYCLYYSSFPAGNNNCYIHIYIYNQTKGETILDDTKVSNMTYDEDHKVTFNVEKGDVIYIKRYSEKKYSIYCELYIEGATCPTSEYTVPIEDEPVSEGTTVTCTAETRPGKTFIGWYEGDTQVCASLTYTFDMPRANPTYEARWIDCPVTLEADAGATVKGVERTVMGEQTTITANVRNGYTWLGWYEGDVKVSEGNDLSYSFKMTDTPKTYKARVSKIILVKTAYGSMYMGRIDSNLEDAVRSVGDVMTATATTNDGYGYIWVGWFDGDTKISEGSDKTITFTITEENKTYTAKWNKVDISRNNTDAGTVPYLTGSYNVGDEVTITATTRVGYGAGYTWVGWFDGDTKVSVGTSLSYTFNLPATPKTYEARWCKVTLERNDTAAGSTTDFGGEWSEYAFVVGEEVTATATTRAGYTWLGWFDGDTKVSEGTSQTFTFTMPAEDKTYTAKWIACPITLDKNIAEAGTVGGVEGATAVGAETTVTATTNAGYTWLGWFDGDTKVSEGTSLSYTFTMPAENKIYTAKWTYYTLTTTTNLPAAGTYSQKNAEKVTAGQEVTLTATTNTGYTFLGWYDGDTKVSEGTSLTYTINMPAENKTYTAKWASYTLTTTTNLSAAGTYTQKNAVRITAGQEVTLTATTNAGYTFLGWFDGDTKISVGTSLSYTFTMPAESKTYTAKWIVCPITLVKNISEAGTVSGVNAATAAGEDVTVTATTNAGYTWLGWFDGDTKVSEGTSLSYTFAMPAENKTYTAKWIACPITLVKNIAEAGNVSGVEGATADGTDVTITATTNAGYTWLGWFDGDTKVSEGTSLSYNFVMSTENKVYTAMWYKIGIEKNILEAGSVIAPNGVYAVGDEATITATTNAGYTWLGWFDGDTKVSKGTSLSYTFVMSTENKVYTAMWYKIGIEKNILEAGSVIAPNGVYAVGDEATITAATNAGYTWLGWYDGDTKISEGTSLSFTFAMPEENIIYTARWQVSDEMEYFYFTSTETTCCITGIKDVMIAEIVIPDYITSISERAFENCVGLTSITIPASVNHIGDYAFSGCYRLVEVYNKSSLSITTGSSSNGHIGYYAKNIYKTAGGSKLSLGEDNILRYTNGSIVSLIVYRGSNTNLIIPNDITEINRGAFYGCSELVSITIPNSVTSIGNYAFYGCSGLTSIAIPSGVSSIGNMTFSGCSTIESITIPFVGGSKTATSAQSSTLFGYIFGTSFYTGATSTRQYYSASSSTIYYIPATLRSITVTGGNILYGAFYGCSNLNSISITNGVTSIGNNAFYGCSGLASINIPNSVTSIGERAFYNCSGITDVGIPNSVTSIGNMAFYGCSSLESISIPFIGSSKAATSAQSSTLFGYIFGTSSYTGAISTRQYYSASASTIYYIPATLRSITVTGGNILYGAFYGCSGLTSISILDSVTNIGASAFYGCTGLTSIAVPDSVNSIGSSAFYGCSSLNNITIPFVGSSKTATTAQSSTLFGYIFGTSSYNGAISTRQYYSASASTIYYIPDTLRSVTVTGGNILYGAFYGCSSLTSVAIPDSVTSIGERAFHGCTRLTSITIPDSVTSIGSNAFKGCSKLVEIFNKSSLKIYYGSFGNNAKNIYTTEGGSKLFLGEDNYLRYIDGSTVSLIEYCGSDTIQIIPNDITEINQYAFYLCSELTSISIPDSVTSIGSCAFYGTRLTSITIPDSVTSIGTAAFSACMLTSVNFAEGNQLISIGNSAFADCGMLTSVTIPEGVTSIGELAFYSCQKLISIIVPDSVTSIGVDAFGNCNNLSYNEYDNACYLGNETNPYVVLIKAQSTSVTSPKIHQNTKCIYSSAFEDCSALTSITIAPSVTFIGTSAFEGCTKLTSIIIPENVTAIRYMSFYNCTGLTTITISASVTSIGQSAFKNCSGLTSINYQGTKAQWSAISKGDFWNTSTGNYTVHCTDGNIAKS